jgi:AbrB family looped-hinge helix DNA binding protein
MTIETTKVGRRGTVVLPAKMRRRLGLDEGALVVVEEQNGGILLRPAVARAIRIYTPEQKAEFLLNNAIDAEDYEGACEAVREMGLDPEKIEHLKPDTGRAARKR